jgi:hypothetical protein
MKNQEEILRIVSECVCTLDENLRMVLSFDVGGRPYLQIAGMQPCSVSGEMKFWSGRKWMLSLHMTESEIVGTVFKAWETWFEHELRERFRYKGVQVFDPHRSIQALLQLDGVRDVRD